LVQSNHHQAKYKTQYSASAYTFYCHVVHYLHILMFQSKVSNTFCEHLSHYSLAAYFGFMYNFQANNIFQSFSQAHCMSVSF